MPRTATNQNLDRPAVRARQATSGTANRRRSQRAVPDNLLASTPVLFRLPTVSQNPLTMPETIENEDAAESAPDIESRVGNSPGVTKPLDTAETNRIQFPPGFPEYPERLAKIATEAAAISSSQPMPQLHPNDAAPAPSSHTVATTLDDSSERSWWEHWSSGIVLILLIIALVTASIVAFNENEVPDSEMLMGSESSTAANAIDLTQLSIPQVTLTEPDKNQPTMGNTAAESSLASSDSLIPTNTGSQPNEMPRESLPSEPLTTPASMASTSVGLQLAGPSLPTAKENSNSQAAGSPSLLSSTQQGLNGGILIEPPESLTTPSSTANSATVTSTGQNTPANEITLGAPTLLGSQSRPTESNTLLPSATLTNQSVVGASPSLYDGAKYQDPNAQDNPMDPGSSVSAPLTVTENDSLVPSATQTPASLASTNPGVKTQTSLASSLKTASDVPNPATGATNTGGDSVMPSSPPPQTAQGSVNAPTQSATGLMNNTIQPQTNPPVGQTTTPHFDSEAVIRAYEAFRRQANSTGETTNRYPSSSNQAPSPSGM